MSRALVVPFDHDVLVPSDDHLHAVLSRALARSRPRARIVGMTRAPCPNSSSWWLEEITLDLDDQTRIALVFKDLIREAKGSGARQVKPAFVTDPTREPWVYQNLLMDATPGAPTLWATETDSGGGRHWLFIERVNGAPLAQVGDRDAWCAAAEWLGHFHATAPVRRAAQGPLLRHNREYHWRWLTRALSAARRNPVARERFVRLRALTSVHEHAIETALATGASLIHGEFYASNVLLEQIGATFAVRPVDWEMAALGPPLLDLAALMSGRWNTADRIAMARSYCEGARSVGVRSPTLGEVLRAVAACRLLLAVQWLGWAAEWTAPAHHQNDWLEEAELCGKELQR
ncbi:MAG TPA: aminoglycoside phosphotransferase family protein [Gemmatimonadaceae bacterium]